MDDEDTKQELPIHVFLCASEYAKLKTSSVPRVEKPGERVAELTSFGWTIMFPGDQQAVYSEFQERLVLHPQGCFEVGLLWKAVHQPLPNNQNESVCRLANSAKKLEKEPNHLDKYDRIIQDQLGQGIVERVNDEPQGEREFYLSHKLVIREAAQSTKMHTSAKASQTRSKAT
ncbi:hypothetical protein ACROYT_G019342 [Oculina patagonica]